MDMTKDGRTKGLQKPEGDAEGATTVTVGIIERQQDNERYAFLVYINSTSSDVSQSASGLSDRTVLRYRESTSTGIKIMGRKSVCVYFNVVMISRHQVCKSTFRSNRADIDGAQIKTHKRLKRTLFNQD